MIARRILKCSATCGPCLVHPRDGRLLVWHGRVLRLKARQREICKLAMQTGSGCPEHSCARLTESKLQAATRQGREVPDPAMRKC